MNPSREEKAQPGHRGLIDALGLEAPPGIVSVVGGGGKTSLLFELARLLPGRTVLTTTTRIFASQARQAEAFCSLQQPDWEKALADAPSGTLVAGALEDRHAMGVAP
jgi:probable selenium-dependent hydroxylase accessory protein YqeC